MEYKIEDLEEKYDLELNRVLDEIEKAFSGDEGFSVLLQFPDGLKPYALVISDYIEREIKNKGLGIGRFEVMIWLGDCFGACDLPESGCDLLVQFGHSEW